MAGDMSERQVCVVTAGGGAIANVSTCATFEPDAVDGQSSASPAAGQVNGSSRRARGRHRNGSSRLRARTTKPAIAAMIVAALDPAHARHNIWRDRFGLASPGDPVYRTVPFPTTAAAP